MAEFCVYGRENTLMADALLRRGPQFWEYIWNHKAQIRVDFEYELQLTAMATAYHSMHRLRYA